MLMDDGDLDATSISMDHDAMLSSNPKKNQAFMRVFDSYVGGKKGDTLQSSPSGTTQLAQQGRQAKGSGGSDSDMNSRLASEMQAKLTASSEDDDMMTPHCEC